MRRSLSGCEHRSRICGQAHSQRSIRGDCEIAQGAEVVCENGARTKTDLHHVAAGRGLGIVAAGECR